jgi:hypothetical protein
MTDVHPAVKRSLYLNDTDWHGSRVSNDYRDRYEGIFGKEDIFKNLRKEEDDE